MEQGKAANNTSFLRELLPLAVPIILQSLFSTAVGLLCSTGHPVHYKLRPHGEMYSFEVIIEDNVWIGGNVSICPGVRIGANSVIGAGSVVIKDVPPNTIAAGNPCKAIREITDRDLEYYYRDRHV